MITRSVLTEKGPFLIEIKEDIYFSNYWYWSFAGKKILVRKATSQDLEGQNMFVNFSYKQFYVMVDNFGLFDRNTIIRVNENNEFILHKNHCKLL